MRWLFRMLMRLVVGIAVFASFMILPVIYVEAMCRGDAPTSDYEPILAAEYHRSEARTLMTYPEWHIVHAYDGYAKIIDKGEPHDFSYLQAILGFWSSLCSLSEKAPDLGGADAEIKQTIYVIGVSFTAELALKAAYEETAGRLATWIRGPEHSPLDELSADQAAAYAEFLQQTPWYKWDFDGDVAGLSAKMTGAFRDLERRFALGVEYGTKSAYAGLIASAVKNVGADELTLRMIVAGLSEAQVAEFEGATVIEKAEQGIVIETPRYRALTNLLVTMAEQGAEFVEIAGNDDILYSITSDARDAENALVSFDRQAYGDSRHLFVVKVIELAERLRSIGESGARLEHIHDY